jgi:hypothetical protein
MEIFKEAPKEEIVGPEIDSVENFIGQVKEKGGDKIDLDSGQEEYKIGITGGTLLVYLTNYKSDTPKGEVKFNEVNHVIEKGEEKIDPDLKNRNTATVYTRTRELNSKLPEGVKINFPLKVLNMNEQEYQEWLGIQKVFGNDPFIGPPKPLVEWKSQRKGLVPVQKR